MALGFAALASACGAGGQPTPAVSPTATVEVTANEIAFTEAQIALPADAPFAIDFDNQDSVPHNVSIHGSGEARTGDVVTGPSRVTYIFSGLPEGTYRFQCDVHPMMAGTVIVGASAAR